MDFGDYRLDLKLTAYWLIGIAIVVSAVILGSSYFDGSADLELKIDDEVEIDEQVTLKASYPGESPEITVEGNVIGEGSATYSFNESGNYTVTAEAKGDRVEKTVSVVDSQSGSDSTGDEDGQGTDQGQNDTDGEQNNTEDNTEEDDNQAEENHPEPEKILLSPDEGSTFETDQGETTDIPFEASVEITKGSGTASIIIDGSEAYTQDLSQGENNIKTTQALYGGSHSWSIKVDTEEFDITSNSRAFTVKEVEVEHGLSLQNNATAGEYNYVRLYEKGEPVEGTEITVNDDVIGATDSKGEVGFEVPNANEIKVSASGYDSITRIVEGYEEVNTPLVYSASIQNPSSGEVQKPFTFEANVDAGLADSYEIKNSNQVFASGSLTGNSTNTVSKSISPPNGEQTLEFVVTNSENDNSTSRSLSVDVWDKINIIKPSSPESFVIDYEFNILDDRSGKYNVFVDGQILDSGFKESGQKAISKENIVIYNAGDHDFWVEFNPEGDEKLESNKVEFKTEQDASPVSVGAATPAEGDLIDDSGTGINETGFEWGYETFFPVYHWSIIKVDESKIFEREEFVNGSKNINYDTSISKGVHEYKVVLKNELNSTIKRETPINTFYLVPYSLKSPQEGNTYSQSMNVEFSAEVQSTAEYYVYIDSSQVASGTVSTGDDISEQVNLQTGQHNFELGLSPSSTNEVFKTEKITFNVD